MCVCNRKSTVEQYSIKVLCECAVSMMGKDLLGGQ